MLPEIRPVAVGKGKVDARFSFLPPPPFVRLHVPMPTPKIKEAAPPPFSCIRGNYHLLSFPSPNVVTAVGLLVPFFFRCVRLFGEQGFSPLLALGRVSPGLFSPFFLPPTGLPLVYVDKGRLSRSFSSLLFFFLPGGVSGGAGRALRPALSFFAGSSFFFISVAGHREGYLGRLLPPFFFLPGFKGEGNVDGFFLFFSWPCPDITRGLESPPPSFFPMPGALSFFFDGVDIELVPPPLSPPLKISTGPQNDGDAFFPFFLFSSPGGLLSKNPFLSSSFLDACNTGTDQLRHVDFLLFSFPPPTPPQVGRKDQPSLFFFFLFFLFLLPPLFSSARPGLFLLSFLPGGQ